ncbi:MAG: BlaI/MecI/CopY family transcriptional regulator [Sciscionella sp.]|nr:BlaI/MecI/CopY family transcriptional regulator [Sciscionella sp.]
MASVRRSRGDLERAVLRVLAARQRAMTPAEVRDELGGELAYTTVLTVLTRLHRKGSLTRQPYGRGYRYRIVRDAAELIARRMHSLLASEGDRAKVLTRFVGTLGPDDELLLRSLLEHGGDA